MTALCSRCKLVALALFLVTILAGFIGSRQSVPQHRADAGLDHLVGRLRLCVGVRRRPVAADQSVAHDVRSGRAALPKAAGRNLSLDRPYPARLGVWPAVLLLLGFSWIELVYPSPAVPLHLAWIAIGYSILTFARHGAVRPRRWLRHGEVFTVVFGTFARFAPTDARAGPPRQLLLRPFGAGLLDSAAVSTSMTAFVLLLLATVLFDGASTSPEWSNLEGALTARLSLLGEPASMAVKTAGLVGVLARAERRLCRHLRDHEPRRRRGDRAPLEHRAQLRLHAGPDRDRLPCRALPHVPAGAGAIHHPARVRPVRLRLEPVRHRRLSRRHRDRRRALCLVRGARRGAHRPHRGGLSRAPQGDGSVRRLGHRAALAGAADRTDGGLHLRQPFDSGRADRRAARARAALLGCSRRCCGSGRRGAVPSPAAGRLLAGRAGQIAPGRS